MEEPAEEVRAEEQAVEEELQAPVKKRGRRRKRRD